MIVKEILEEVLCCVIGMTIAMVIFAGIIAIIWRI